MIYFKCVDILFVNKTYYYIMLNDKLVYMNYIRYMKYIIII